MTNSMPWFRVYSEILDDRKIKRICKKTGHSKALVIGLWICLLSIANDAPERGHLKIADDLPYTMDDLEDDTGLPREILDQLLSELKDMGMINGSTTIQISNWNKRQFKSDNSTERVREHRSKRYSNVTMKRYTGVIDSDSEGETESESEEKKKENRLPDPDDIRLFSPAPAAPSLSIEAVICKASGMVALPPKEYGRIEQVRSFIEKYGEEKTVSVMENNYQKWINTKRKDGNGTYRATNLGWVDWAQEELLKVDNTPPPIKPPTPEEQADYDAYVAKIKAQWPSER